MRLARNSMSPWVGFTVEVFAISARATTRFCMNTWNSACNQLRCYTRIHGYTMVFVPVWNHAHNAWLLVPSPFLQTCPDGLKHRAIMLNSDTNDDISINRGSCLHSALPRDVIDGFWRQPADLQLIHASTFHGPFCCCRKESKDGRSRTTVPAEYT